MIVGILVYVIIIAMQLGGSKYLVPPKDEQNVGGQVKALIITILIHIVCLAMCCYALKRGDSDDIKIEDDYKHIADPVEIEERKFTERKEK
jgi:hypothetical protein